MPVKIGGGGLGAAVVNPIATVANAPALAIPGVQGAVEDLGSRLGFGAGPSFQDAAYKPGAFQVNQEAFAPIDPSSVQAQQQQLAQQVMAGRYDPRNSTARGAQQQLLTQLQDQVTLQAQGKRPSLAEMAANRQREQGLKDIMAQTVSARGANPALALRGAQQASAALSGDIQSRLAMQKLQEQQALQNQLAQVAAATRQGDQSFQGLQQQALQTRGGLLQAIRGQDQALAQFNAQSRQAGEQARLQAYLGREGLAQSSFDANEARRAAHQQAKAAGAAATRGQVIGAIGGGLGAAAKGG